MARLKGGFASKVGKARASAKAKGHSKPKTGAAYRAEAKERGIARRAAAAEKKANKLKACLHRCQQSNDRASYYQRRKIRDFIYS